MVRRSHRIESLRRSYFHLVRTFGKPNGFNGSVPHRSRTASSNQQPNTNRPSVQSTQNIDTHPRKIHSTFATIDVDVSGALCALCSVLCAVVLCALFSVSRLFSVIFCVRFDGVRYTQSLFVDETKLARDKIT